MPTKSDSEKPQAPGAAPHVAILMCTKDGAAYLDEQMESIVQQTHANWSLTVSDDGSTDATRDILKSFAARCAQRIDVRDGPRLGACANFLTLATDVTIEADYFAFCDQDDIWYDDKLERALTWLAGVPQGIPAVYCGRTELISDDGQSYGFSPLFNRPIAFSNAIVQSLGGGNTMVFNKAAKRLLEATGRLDVVLHDWWMYQLVSAVGGAMHYDPLPMLKYRQHGDNLIGSNLGWRARLVRLRMIFKGRLSDWNNKNIAALERIPAPLIKPENRATLRLFAKARTAPSVMRLYYLWRSGVYRQTMLGNVGLIFAAALKRI